MTDAKNIETQNGENKRLFTIASGHECIVLPQSPKDSYITCGQILNENCEFPPPTTIDSTCLSTLPYVANAWIGGSENYNKTRDFICKQFSTDVSAEAIHKIMQDTINDVKKNPQFSQFVDCSLGEPLPTDCEFSQQLVDKLKKFYKCS